MDCLTLEDKGSVGMGS